MLEHARFDKWGDWRYDPDRMVLVLERTIDERSKAKYEVDLEKCTNCEGILNWIAQMAGKTWPTPEDIAGLVYAMNDLLGFQENVCHSRFDKEKLDGLLEQARIVFKTKADAKRMRNRTALPPL